MIEINNSNTLHGLFLIGHYTQGRMTLWQLAGPNMARTRVKIMKAFLGVDKYPQAKSGIYALTELAYEHARKAGANIPEDKHSTIAAQEKAWEDWAAWVYVGLSVGSYGDDYRDNSRNVCNLAA
jgi:hypothetical protein